MQYFVTVIQENEYLPEIFWREYRRLVCHDEKPVETIGCCFAWRKSPLAINENVQPGEKTCKELRQAISWL